MSLVGCAWLVLADCVDEYVSVEVSCCAVVSVSLVVLVLTDDDVALSVLAAVVCEVCAVLLADVHTISCRRITPESI